MTRQVSANQTTMAQIGYLASTILMGLFLVAVVAFLRLTERRQYTPTLAGPRGGPVAVLRGTAQSEMAWIVGFLLATFVVGLASVIYVGGLVPENSGLVATAGRALGTILAVLLGGYLLWGAYSMARGHGYQHAAAVMVSAWMVGLLFVAAIVGYLFLG